MEPFNKNYYCALGFADRPDLHMTLAYFKNVRPGEIDDLVKMIWNYTVSHRTQQFDLASETECWLSKNRSVRAIEFELSNLPEWVKAVQSNLTVAKGSRDFLDFIPHVTCDDDELVLTVNSIGLWHKQNMIAGWELDI